ncbi:MAG TPA: glycosyltransferase family 2 protein [bacterium]|nr:glycosyltransferase family 2 protein [bacterium]
MKTALVSVVIPAFHRVPTIGAAWRSVQAQTHRDWEAIAVDDGSTDGTAEVVMRLAHEDDRIKRIRHDRNCGAQAARNAGIRSACGEWIAFLDSDDQWLPQSLDIPPGCSATDQTERCALRLLQGV